MNCINSSLYCALTAAMWRLWMCWRRLGFCLAIILITIIIKHPDITITLIIIISFPELEIHLYPQIGEYCSSLTHLSLANCHLLKPADFQVVSINFTPPDFKRWNKIDTLPTSSGFGPSGALDLSQPVQNLSEPDIIVGHPLQ